MGGLTLGGGIGYLSRGHGLSCDNLRAAEVVTADGRVVNASANENEDLFWALRGGGGNFGVVTAFEYDLHPVREVYGGPILFELSDAADVLRFYREFIRDAPEEFGGFPAWQIAPPLPFIPEDRQGEPFLIFVTCWAGPIEQGEAALKPLREVAPVVAEHVGPMPYPAINSAFDGLVPAGLQHYWKANFVKELSDDAIAAHLEHGPKVPTVNSTVHIYPINGACHRVAPDATAFAYRDATFATVIAGMWPDPADNDANTAWVRGFYDATAPLLGAGRLRQLHGRRRPGADQGQLQGQLRPPGRRQAQVRPRQPLPPQPEHQALGSRGADACKVLANGAQERLGRLREAEVPGVRQLDEPGAGDGASAGGRGAQSWRPLTTSVGAAMPASCARTGPAGPTGLISHYARRP